MHSIFGQFLVNVFSILALAADQPELAFAISASGPAILGDRNVGMGFINSFTQPQTLLPMAAFYAAGQAHEGGWAYQETGEPYRLASADNNATDAIPPLVPSATEKTPSFWDTPFPVWDGAAEMCCLTPRQTAVGMGVSLGIGATAVGGWALFGGAAAVESGGAATLYGGAQSALAGPALAGQLATESAASAFTVEGTLSEEALAGSREIMPNSKLGDPMIPSGFSKFTTQTYQSPSGDFQVHFYMNPITRAFYNYGWKSIFNSGRVGP
jgi:hypothetical protein